MVNQIFEEAKAKINTLRERIANYDQGRGFMNTKRKKYGFSLAYKYPGDKKPFYVAQRIYKLNMFEKYIQQILDLNPLPEVLIYEEFDGYDNTSKQTDKSTIVLQDTASAALGDLRFPTPTTFAARASANGQESPAEIEARIRAELEQRNQVNSLNLEITRLNSDNENLRSKIADQEEEILELEEKLEAKNSGFMEQMKEAAPLLGMLMGKGGLQGLFGGNQQTDVGSLPPAPVESANPNTDAFNALLSTLDSNQTTELMFVISAFNANKAYIHDIAQMLS